MNPDQLEAGRALHQAGKLAEAELVYRRVLGEDPSNTQVLNLLWSLLSQRGDFSAALEAIQSAVRHRPSDATLRYNLATALMNVGQPDAAAKAYREVLKHRPDFADGHFSLGYALQRQGRLAEAERCFRKALRLEPGSAPAHNHLGMVLLGLEIAEDAAASFRRALSINPDSAQAHSNLGSALLVLRQFTEAGDSYRHALRLNPRLGAAHTGLANALFALGRAAEALQHYREGVQWEPDSANAHHNLGHALQRFGSIREALEHLQQAIALEPNLGLAHSYLAESLLPLGRFDDAERHFRRALELQPDSPVANSYWALFLIRTARRSTEEVRAWHQDFGQRFAFPQQRHENSPDQDRPLRVGYLSPDFRTHSVAFFVAPVLASHDRRNFEVTCYSNSGNVDAMTQRLRSQADRWREVVSHSDEACARLVREDGIDILIDLCGHMADNRLLVFARKPAPVQATWLGYPTITGVPTIDFRLTDPQVDEPGLPHSGAEQPLRLPSSYFCYGGPGVDVDIGPLPALQSGRITFGSFNNLAKITNETIALWSRVLRAVPDARLLLKSTPLVDPFVGAALQKRLADEGVEPGRVVLQAAQPAITAHLSSYQQVDICLDTYPYNGATTTCEALWMGVPVVSLCGETHASRMGKSILSAAGLQAFVCNSADEFLAKSVATARDLPRLVELRASLRGRLLASPLMDAERFTRDLENAYRAMWRDWCNSHPP